MKNDDKHLDELRRQAEKRLGDRLKDPLKLRSDQLPSLVHELEVHQIELEMQNEDLRRAQELLERARDRYVDLYDYAPVGYLTVGPTGLIQEANLTACSLFETERATLIGQRLVQFITAEYQDTLYMHHRRLLAGKGAQTFELVMWGSTDRRFYAQVKLALLSERIGTIGAYRIVINDITHRKQAEEQGDRLQRELQLARKWEALGQLAGGIAHDFNNMLAIMLGNTELLRQHFERSGSIKWVSYLDHIQKAGEKAAALVSQVLAFSSSRSVQPKLLQLRSIIREDMKMLSSLLPASIEIKTEFEDQLPDILIDPAELSQAFINVAINARDAMEGKGVLTIRLNRTGEKASQCAICHQQLRGDWVELSITDTGCGIEPEVFDHIFDPFFSTKEIGKGTGMGLAVVHGILRRSGGHILVESKPGIGSTFHLLFSPSSGIGTTTKPQNLDEYPASPTNGQGEQILVLDDEPDLANMLGDLLINHGYRAKVMTDSQKTLNLFKESPDEFALVLSDQTMPVMTGLELVILLREIRPDIPVILSSGFSSSIDAQSAAEMNIVYLEKPVGAKRLIPAVEGLLRPTGQR